MSLITRRNFLKTGVATSALAGMGGVPLLAERAAATDRITLGRTNVKITRLAFGTGTHNGHVQRQLGQDVFNRMIRHAYDQGIRFFETAQSYPGMPEMLGTALKGIPRDSYALMSKVTTNDADRLPRLTQCACNRRPNSSIHAASRTDRAQLAFRQPPLAGWNPGNGTPAGDWVTAPVHGLQALHQVPGDKWLEIAMIRMNHKGTRMDNENDDWEQPGNVPDVVEHVKQAHAAGKGVISMKLIGEGAFTVPVESPQAMRFAFRNAGVDAVPSATRALRDRRSDRKRESRAGVKACAAKSPIFSSPPSSKIRKKAERQIVQQVSGEAESAQDSASTAGTLRPQKAVPEIGPSRADKTTQTSQDLGRGESYSILQQSRLPAWKTNFAAICIYRAWEGKVTKQRRPADWLTAWNRSPSIKIQARVTFSFGGPE